MSVYHHGQMSYCGNEYESKTKHVHERERETKIESVCVGGRDVEPATMMKTKLH